MPKKTKKSLDRFSFLKKFKFNKRKVGILAVFVVLIGLAYLLKGVVLAATVNGKPILRYSVIKTLEKQNGKDALESLVTESLILQEAQKQGISVLPKDVNEEVKKIEDRMTAQGQNLDSVLELQGMSRSDLEKQIRIQKMIEKIFADKLNVSGEEVDKYIEENKDLLPKDQDVNTLRADVLSQLKQQKLSQEFYPWLQNIKQGAKINYFVNY